HGSMLRAAPYGNAISRPIHAAQTRRHPFRRRRQLQRLDGSRQAGTLEQLKTNRARIFDPCVAAQGGRVVKLMGDGALVEFGSVVAAVNSALAIQEATTRAELERAEAKRIRYRIGINLGDV